MMKVKITHDLGNLKTVLRGMARSQREPLKALGRTIGPEFKRIFESQGMVPDYEGYPAGPWIPPSVGDEHHPQTMYIRMVRSRTIFRENVTKAKSQKGLSASRRRTLAANATKYRETAMMGALPGRSLIETGRLVRSLSSISGTPDSVRGLTAHSFLWGSNRPMLSGDVSKHHKGVVSQKARRWSKERAFEPYEAGAIECRPFVYLTYRGAKAIHTEFEAWMNQNLLRATMRRDPGRAYA